jgi:hypothetical protein
MANVFIEARPKGRPEGVPLPVLLSRITLTTCLRIQTQHEAIEWAKKQHHRPLFARVRHLNDKKFRGGSMTGYIWS